MISVVKIVDFSVYNNASKASQLLGEDVLLYAFAVLDNFDRTFLVSLILTTSCWSTIRMKSNRILNPRG